MTIFEEQHAPVVFTTDKPLYVSIFAPYQPPGSYRSAPLPAMFGLSFPLHDLPKPMWSADLPPKMIDGVMHTRTNTKTPPYIIPKPGSTLDLTTILRCATDRRIRHDSLVKGTPLTLRVQPWVTPRGDGLALSLVAVQVDLDAMLARYDEICDRLFPEART